jgi:hypothetical protein
LVNEEYVSHFRETSKFLINHTVSVDKGYVQPVSQNTVALKSKIQLHYPPALTLSNVSVGREVH